MYFSDLLNKILQPSNEPQIIGNWSISPSIEGKVSRVHIIREGENHYCVKIAQEGQEEFFLGDVKRIQGLHNYLKCAPEIFETGMTRGGKPYCVQSYTAGIPLEQYTATPVAESLAKELDYIHGHHPLSVSWGYPVSENVLTGKHVSLKEVILKKDIEPISLSAHLTETEQETLISLILGQYDCLSSPIHKPCMVHGDCHEGNIMVDEKGHMKLIDFGNVAYFTPEYDFARLLTQKYFRENPDCFSNIKKAYGDIAQRKLDESYMNLFYTTRIAYCLRKPRSAEDVEWCWGALRNIE